MLCIEHAIPECTTCKKTRAVNCDQCRHYDAEIVPFEGWPCVEGHKPRFYAPKTTMEAESGEWGWRRRCADFEPNNAAIAKPEGLA